MKMQQETPEDLYIGVKDSYGYKSAPLLLGPALSRVLDQQPRRSSQICARNNFPDEYNFMLTFGKISWRSKQKPPSFSPEIDRPCHSLLSTVWRWVAQYRGKCGGEVGALEVATPLVALTER